MGKTLGEYMGTENVKSKKVMKDFTTDMDDFHKWKAEKDIKMKELNNHIIESEKNLAMHYHDMYMQGRMTKSQYDKAIASVNKTLKNLGSDYRY
jgi:hypothetical protein